MLKKKNRVKGLLPVVARESAR